MNLFTKKTQVCVEEEFGGNDIAPQDEDEYDYKPPIAVEDE
jgi:hypothetical protein